jgi:sodium-dependent dicarboxylate transporter 2/3/5
MAFFVLMMTNFIMNVAAIAISLAVALVVADMPFLLLVGAAPNAIAYNSKQFTTGDFFLWGLPASGILMVVVWLAVSVIWPMMGMEIYVPVVR